MGCVMQEVMGCVILGMGELAEPGDGWEGLSTSDPILVWVGGWVGAAWEGCIWP